MVITDGTQPIGNGIGPALEARDVLYVLSRHPKRPLDLERKSIMMAGDIFQMLGVKNGSMKALEILNSGMAYKKMKEIISLQNGNPDIMPEDIPVGRYKSEYRASKTGIIKSINNEAVSKIARIAGAPADKGAGIYLYKHVGDAVRSGEPIFTIYAENRDKLDYAVDISGEIAVLMVR